MAHECQENHNESTLDLSRLKIRLRCASYMYVMWFYRALTRQCVCAILHTLVEIVQREIALQDTVCCTTGQGWSQGKRAITVKERWREREGALKHLPNKSRNIMQKSAVIIWFNLSCFFSFFSTRASARFNMRWWVGGKSNMRRSKQRKWPKIFKLKMFLWSPWIKTLFANRPFLVRVSYSFTKAYGVEQGCKAEL